ncbi:hypothetical protein FB451DRAFT_1193398 [Mycena latifolia]|nr:hypothetical protein FB451DRAFT_1193398 [Mycena latifolia]
MPLRCNAKRRGGALPTHQWTTDAVAVRQTESVLTVTNWFFNIGNGRNQVTLLENQEELYKETTHLHQMGWFLAAFHKRAQEAHIDIDEGQSTSTRLQTHSQNKLGNILNSFAHFVYDASYKSIALADIQTTRARAGNRVPVKLPPSSYISPSSAPFVMENLIRGKFLGN